MNVSDRMDEFLGDYQGLWWAISEFPGDSWLGCGDAAWQIIDENDYYCCNFSGEKSVLEIFFTGQSNYFPGIWTGGMESVELDKLPVYVFDIPGGDKIIETEGNFKTFIKQILDDALDQLENYDGDTLESVFYDTDTKFTDVEYFKNECKLAMDDLEQFSDELIDRGDYVLDVIAE